MNMSSFSIPLCKPYLDGTEQKYVMEALKSGHHAHGPFNKRFEELFASFLGVKHAITLNSCTSALELALRANKIRGDVIIPSFTFPATANAVLTAGATPVIVDIRSEDRGIDPAMLEANITYNTEAVIVVHFGGMPCDIGAVKKICDERGLLLIEDSAETLGAKYHGKQAGSFGIGCFSFFPTKIISTGEGGMLTTDDDQLAERVKTLSSHGIGKKENAWARVATMPGSNYRMSNINAAIGVAQMEKVHILINLRQQWAKVFDRYLQDLFQTQNILENRTHVYQMYTVICDDRDVWLQRLRDNGIEASVHFTPPLHKQKQYKSNIPCPIANFVSDHILTLPMYPSMDATSLVRKIRNAYK
jgi:perosamine synthetase